MTDSDADYSECSMDDWNLADASLGAEVIALSDEFFAPCSRILDPTPPQFKEGLYDEHGKWMDGWETRRRRSGGYDWCVIRLAYCGMVTGLEIDTSFFSGNAPAGAALDGTRLPPGTNPDDCTKWEPLLGLITLRGNAQHRVRLETSQPCTHVRMRIYPDGGIARLRVYGVVCPPDLKGVGDVCDLLALANGGRVLAWSDAHYGHPRNLLRPERGRDMSDGWETRRRREPGYDWCILSLGCPGTIEHIDVDTSHFKGNYPASCSIHAARIDGAPDASILLPQSLFWGVLLPEQPLHPNTMHSFTDVTAIGPVTHLRFNIMPDGGVSRLRAYARLA